jgi:hypothetical protein
MIKSRSHYFLFQPLLLLFHLRPFVQSHLLTWPFSIIEKVTIDSLSAFFSRAFQPHLFSLQLDAAQVAPVVIIISATRVVFNCVKLVSLPSKAK